MLTGHKEKRGIRGKISPCHASVLFAAILLCCVIPAVSASGLVWVTDGTGIWTYFTVSNPTITASCSALYAGNCNPGTPGLSGLLPRAGDTLVVTNVNSSGSLTIRVNDNGVAHDYGAGSSFSYTYTGSSSVDSITVRDSSYQWTVASWTMNGTAPTPITNFTGTPISGDVPLEVTFTDSSTGSPTAWIWDFGDGSNSSLENPVHYYAYEGTFSVTLNASNGGGFNSFTRTNYITTTAVSPLTNILFTATPLTGYGPLNVVFSDMSTQTNTVQNWTFGDGYIANGSYPSVNHTYTNTSGYFSPRLNAFFGGTWRTLTRSQYIFVNRTILSFYANTTNATAPGTVQFWSNFS